MRAHRIPPHSNARFMYTSGTLPSGIQGIMPLPKVKLPTESSQQSSIQQDLDRPTAIQIYEHVTRNGRRELARSKTTLAISGIVGGLTMGLTSLSVSAVTARLGYSASAQFIAFLLYPIGFMAVIPGR